VRINLNLDQINYDSLFRVWRYSSPNLGRVEKFFIDVKLVIKLTFFKIKFLDHDKKNPKILNSYTRLDYSNFIDRITRNTSLGLATVGYQFGFGHKLKYFRDVRYQAKLNSLEFHEALLLYFLIKNNDIFYKFLENQSVVILFAEMQIFENYMAQVARQVGCFSIGLQHGFYSNDYDRPTLNSLNYKNVAVDEILVWGLNSQKLLLEHNPTLRVSVVGRPSTHFLVHDDFHLDSDFPTSYVAILDADEFADTNDIVIQFGLSCAKKDGVSFFLKCHPGTNLSGENLKHTVLQDVKWLGKCPYFIGYRSSLLIELAADGFSCMVLENSPFLGSNKNLLKDDQCFVKLGSDDVSNYLACSSDRSEELIKKAISKHISS
tara:strand:- start:4900 stop:6027 length:1128 start_codon:yes stop_codon:yes gene_type:complete